jgi:hypothetical protein
VFDSRDLIRLVILRHKNDGLRETRLAQGRDLLRQVILKGVGAKNN